MPVRASILAAASATVAGGRELTRGLDRHAVVESAAWPPWLAVLQLLDAHRHVDAELAMEISLGDAPHGRRMS